MLIYAPLLGFPYSYVCCMSVTLWPTSWSRLEAWPPPGPPPSWISSRIQSISALPSSWDPVRMWKRWSPASRSTKTHLKQRIRLSETVNFDKKRWRVKIWWILYRGRFLFAEKNSHYMYFLPGKKFKCSSLATNLNRKLGALYVCSVWNAMEVFKQVVMLNDYGYHDVYTGEMFCRFGHWWC